MASVIGAQFQIIEYRPGLVIREHLPPELAGRPEVAASTVPGAAGDAGGDPDRRWNLPRLVLTIWGGPKVF